MLIAGQSGSNRKNLSRAKKLDIICKREDTFSLSFDVYYVDDQGQEQAYDFTGCNLKMHVKKKATDTTAVIYMVVSATGNVITLSRSAEDMDVDAGRYVYDIELYDMDGENITILYGNFFILQDVTHFQTVIELEYDIEFKNEILDELQQVYLSTLSLSETYLYLLELWKQQTSQAIMTNTIAYEIVHWAVFNQIINFGNTVLVSRDVAEEHIINIYNEITYTLEEFQ